MVIGGLQKFSLLDYPGHIAAIIFTQGCNFRCHFCYNPLLVRPQRQDDKLTDTESTKGHPLNISEDDLFAFLKERTGKLDAVVITGGEPTIQPDLPEFIKKIRELDFMVKLDSNGTNPAMLEELLDLGYLDYIAMDIKGPAGKYDLIAGSQPDLLSIGKSIKMIMASGLPYEFRTTIVPELILLEDVDDIGSQIKGADKWFIQKFRSDIDLVNHRFEGVQSYSDADMRKIKEIAERYVKMCEIR